jgi:hypothetical protein
LSLYKFFPNILVILSAGTKAESRLKEKAHFGHSPHQLDLDFWLILKFLLQLEKAGKYLDSLENSDIIRSSE